MKIVINTKNTIPVEIGDLLFEVSVDDKDLDLMAEKFELVGNKLNGAKAEKITELTRSFVEALDILLGEGAGHTIYEKYPSTLTLSEITVQLTANLKEEFAARFSAPTQSDLANTYLSKK